MPAEEARQVAASFTGSAFAPPPRTINDITAILDQQQLADPGASARARARADQSPPDTGDPDTLAAFYYGRGVAAGEVGRARQEIDDLTEAARWAARGSGSGEHEILFSLGIAEVTGGNFSRGMEYMRRAIPKVPRRHDGWLVSLHGNLASLYARAGDMEAAESAVQQAQSAFERSRTWWIFYPSHAIAAMRASLAEARAGVLAARGEFAEADTFYRQAVTALAGNSFFSKHPWHDYLIGRLAENLVRQGRFLEAESEARAALLGALRHRGRYAPQTANILSMLAHVLSEQGRFAEVETLARAAIAIYQKIGTPPDSLLFAVARTWLGAALVVQSRWREALAEYEVIHANMAGDPQAYQKYLAGDFGWALALLRTGQADRALEMLDVALSRSQGMGEKYASTAQIRGFRGMAYAARGDRRRALREFSESIPLLLARFLQVDDETTSRPMQDQLLTLILDAYIGLLIDIRGTPLEPDAGVAPIEEAFRLADAARGRSVQRALDQSAARAAAGTPALAELVRKEQDARKQLSALYGTLANALAQPTDQQNPRVVAALRARAEALGREREVLNERIRREFPSYFQLINPTPVTVARAQAALRPGEALIVTYAGQERTFVWAVPHRGTAAFAAVPMGERSLEAAASSLRKALDPGARTLGDLPQFDLSLAHELYSALLMPVRAGWAGAKGLLVVPHGALGQLPFSLLPTTPAALGPERDLLFAGYRRVPWLVRTHAVTVLPSVTSLVTLRELPPGDRARRPFVGFGDPYFSQQQAGRAARESTRVEIAPLTARGLPMALRSFPETRSANRGLLAMLPRLPDTAEEIQSIGAALNADLARDVYLGERANERTVKTLDLSMYRVVAFATHGLVPGDLDGLLQPALALSAPEVAGVDGDGLLTMEEILGLRLNADWVVLSACNTASGQGAGAEAVSGLGRAFFYAGARALLVSNWPVETTSARALTTDLFRRQRTNPGLTRARTLQDTMNWLIDEGVFVDPRTGRVAFSYAHPIFWAPFTLVGDGG